MEPIRRRPQDITPGRPLSGRPGVPAGHRAVFNDFAGRPQARPVTHPTRPPATPRPVTPQTAPPLPHPASQPTLPHHTAPPHSQQQAAAPRPNPALLRPTAPLLQPATVPPTPRNVAAYPAQPKPAQTPGPLGSPTTSNVDMPATPPSEYRPPRPFAATPKTPGHRSHPSRASLVGFICFMLLAGLLLSPFLPSKTFDSFPGSSQSSSSGDDTLACIHELQQPSTATTYDHKLGSPITYSYATTTTQKAACDNKPLAAVAGHTGQFNPLGLLVDITLATAIAVAVAKIWRRIFDRRD